MTLCWLTLFVEGVNDHLLDHCQVSSVPHYCGFKEQKIPTIYTVWMVIYWNSNVNIRIFWHTDFWLSLAVSSKVFYFTCNESNIYESFTFWNKLQEKKILFHYVLFLKYFYISIWIYFSHAIYSFDAKLYFQHYYSSLQVSHVSGFCHFGLMSFMGFVTEPWQLPSCPVFSLALFHVGAWCSDHGTHVMSFGFVSGFGHSCSTFCLFVGVCVLEFARPRALLSTCVLWLHAVRVLSAAHIHIMSCAVWHVACVFHGLRAFMLSCLVWTRDLWVFSLAACSCPVLHMAGDLYCMAFVLVFCVPCALM